MVNNGDYLKSKYTSIKGIKVEDFFLPFLKLMPYDRLQNRATTLFFLISFVFCS